MNEADADQGFEQGADTAVKQIIEPMMSQSAPKTQGESEVLFFFSYLWVMACVLCGKGSQFRFQENYQIIHQFSAHAIWPKSKIFFSSKKDCPSLAHKLPHVSVVINYVCGKMVIELVYDVVPWTLS